MNIRTSSRVSFGQRQSSVIRAARTTRGAVGLALSGAVILIAAVGPFLAPRSSTAFVTTPFASQSGHVWLGGDVLGRDVLSRVLDGGWVLLLMAACATALAVGGGAITGMAAGYLRGMADGAIMRTCDILLAFPQIVFALLLVSLLGPKRWLIVLAIGLTHLPQGARVVRAATLDISERDFVKAAEAIGTGRLRVMVGEILPNLATPLMVEVGLRLTYSVIFISALSFLGFGTQPPAPDWGVMINENRLGIGANVWAVLAPAALIAILTIGTNTFTDALARVSLGIEGREESDPLLASETGVTMAGLSE